LSRELEAGDKPDLKGTTWAVVLAAGGSRRMGEAKQLMPWRGRALVHWAVSAAQAVVPGRVLVVAGHAEPALRQVLAGSAARIVSAPDWQRGLSRSIRAGIAALPDDCQGALLMACDQPGVDAGALGALLALAHPHGAVAAGYAGTVGIPAWFPRSMFAALVSLEGDAGARQLLRKGPAPRVLPMPAAARDLDVPADLARAAREGAFGPCE